MKRFIEKKRVKLIGDLQDARDRWMDYPIDTIEVDRPRRFEGPRTRSPIPRVLVQTFRVPSVPRPIYSAVLRWQEMNPEFDYRFFDDDSARAYIEERFPKDVLSAYDTLVPAAFRADLWRYCYLAADGGVYADIRMEPLVALRTILDQASEAPPAFVSARDLASSGGGRGRAFLYNAFIAAEPNHPFLVAALERAVHMIATGNYGRDMLDITGPGCLGAAVNDVLGRSIDDHFDVGDRVDERIGRFRILEHDWDPYYREHVSLEGRPAIVGKCIRGPMSNADRSVVRLGYGELYNQRKVFRQAVEGG